MSTHAQNPTQKLLAIFGGTFDPVHNGHVGAVRDLQEAFQFDQIRWVLSARPPHKNQTSASIADRFEMLKIALGPFDTFVADDTEINREEKSYTIDTVQSFLARFPDHEIVLIIGGDSLAKLHTWHRIEELLTQVHFVVMSRPGYSLEVPESLRSRVVETPALLKSSNMPSMHIFEQSNYNVSSTQLRELLATQYVSSDSEKKAKSLLPIGVFDYIKRHQSYRMRGMNPAQIKDQAVEALESLKGQDIRVIDITEVSNFADFMVIASGTSNTHVRALAREASTHLRTQGVKPLGENGADIGEWVLVDFGDVVVHVMRPEVREYYDLEKLWDEDVKELVQKHREEQEADS